MTICDLCNQPIQIGEWPFCPHGHPSGHNKMTPYTVEIDGKSLTITSLQDPNRIERETIARYRNGEGAPLVFRAFHQDHSNRDKNTLEGIGWVQRRPSPTNRPLEVRKGKRD